MTSTIERVDTTIKIPFDEDALLSGNPVLQAGAIFDIVKVLQELLEQITTVTNFNVDSFDGEAQYYALPDANGIYFEGTWRRIQVGDNLEDQVLLDGDSITGTWTQAQVRERPLV